MPCDYCGEDTNFLIQVSNPPRNQICVFCLKQILERIDTSKRPEYPMTSGVSGSLKQEKQEGAKESEEK